MKIYKALLSSALLIVSLSVSAQVDNAGGVRKRNEKDKKESKTNGQVTDRMSSFFESNQTHEADLEYSKQVYRRIDLENGANAALYYPEDIIDGQLNLFRIILGNVIDGKIPAYEYLDGREIFTDQYKIKVGEMLDRFGIYARQAKGSTEKNPKYEIDEADVPSNQVLNYYIIEKWEFDRRTNSMKTKVEAICPVLNRYGDYGGEARYPMFWVKFDALRPYLAQQYVFISDDNNLPQYSLDDYFNLGLYDGEIYKTRNMRNLSLAQMFPDEDDLKHAQDSIDNRLRNYAKDLWVPTREEYLAMKAAEEKKKKDGDLTVVSVDELPERTIDGIGDETVVTVTEDNVIQDSSSARAKKKTKKQSSKKPKINNSVTNSSAEKSVRRRKK
ncbi:MAG: gliding motility protein GldN [Muribaculaceae bacterium]|nr:gliding motility protein GldN [Muribaculaceae bacterium]